MSAKKYKYPATFIKLCKATFPDDTDLVRALKDGSEMVGFYLDQARLRRISPEHICMSINLGKIEELRQLAIELMAAEELYGQWLKINKKQFSTLYTTT